MANNVTNTITVNKGEFDLRDIKSFEQVIPMPKELKDINHDSLIQAVEFIKGVGEPNHYGYQPKTLDELYNHTENPKEIERIKQAVDNIDKYGYASWLNWSIDNWGAKWDMRILDSDKDLLVFETAWTSPINWFKRLAETLPDGVELQHKWTYEDIQLKPSYATASNNEYNIFQN